MPQGESRRLGSWKEIAAYLGVSVRTAQNWEREAGLPVRRVGEGARPHVFALTEELDAWFEAQPGSTVGQGPSGEEAEDAVPGPGPAGRRRVLALVAGLVVLSGLIWIGRGTVIGSGLDARGELHGVEVSGRRLVARDGDGREAWSISLEKAAIDLYRRRVSGRHSALHWIGDVDGDGADELLLVWTPAERHARSSKLVCFRADGRRSWSAGLGGRLEWKGDVFEAFSGSLLEVIPTAERIYAVVEAHSLRFPTEVLLFDARTGERLGIFWHPGRVYSHALADVTGDGKEELLLGLANNPGPGVGHAALAVLPIPFPPPAPGVFDFFGLPAGQTLRYLVFARPHMYADDVLIHAVSGIDVGDSRIVVKVGQHNGVVHYFDRRLRHLRGVVSDNLRRWHVDVSARSQSPHRLTAAEEQSWLRFAEFPAPPDGNGAAVAAALGPEEGGSATHRSSSSRGVTPVRAR